MTSRAASSVNDAAAAADRVRELATVFASEIAFRVFYDRALPRVYGYLLSRCGGDRAVAEELTQQAFVDAVRQRRSFDGRSDPLTWLCGIARHKLADHYRRLEREERRRMRLVVREVDVAGGDREWSAGDRREAVLAALRALPAPQRAALVFRYLDGFTVRDVAREMRRSESATESLLSRARDGFQRAYGERSDV